MKRKPVLLVMCLLFAALLTVVAVGCISQPTFGKNQRSSINSDPERLRAHVCMLSQTLYPRDWTHTSNLEKCADYISTHLTQAGALVESQVFEVQGTQFRNVLGRFGVGKGSKLVIGAHYDACGSTPGADDNASGIAALIEIAYLLGRNAPSREVELVAYVLEEPPFYKSQSMGSAIHAKSLARDDGSTARVIVLEMVGYFNKQAGSQRCPSWLLRLFYPSSGDFIAVAGRWDQGDWIKKVKVAMKGTSDLPVYSIRAPSAFPGIDFSDHANYWQYGIKAVMITDTAFYRNTEYHTANDTADRLDYVSLSKVVVGVFEATRFTK